MFRILKWMFICFAVFIGLFYVWIEIYSAQVRQRAEAIERDYNISSEEYEKINNRPIPDSIYMLPEAEIVSGKRNYLGNDKEAREGNALSINKRDGVYYWDSNGRKPLTVVTETRKHPYKMFYRKASVFSANDGSGSVEIWHDIYVKRGECYLSIAGNARYIEYRINENRELLGEAGFFPPRPDNWCKSLIDRLAEEGGFASLEEAEKLLLENLRNIFGLRENKGESK